MRHWSASKSNEHCFSGKTRTPSTCGAARNCPKSDVSADSSRSCFLKASTLPKIPDVFFVSEHTPTIFCDAHRKKLASAEHHTDEYRLQEAVWDDPYGTMQLPVEDEFPAGQTRRMRQSDR